MLRPLFILLLTLALSPLAPASELPAEERPGFFRRVLNLFGGGGERTLEGGRAPDWARLKLEMRCEPLPIKLADNRQLKVTLTLTNRSKRLVQLAFPTSQRIEVITRDPAGKLVEQWSEDQRFTADPSVVTINPGERLEYAVNLSTRDLAAGTRYTIEGFFPNYEKLRAEQAVVPES